MIAFHQLLQPCKHIILELRFLFLILFTKCIHQTVSFQKFARSLERRHFIAQLLQVLLPFLLPPPFFFFPLPPFFSLLLPIVLSPFCKFLVFNFTVNPMLPKHGTQDKHEANKREDAIKHPPENK